MHAAAPLAHLGTVGRVERVANFAVAQRTALNRRIDTEVRCLTDVTLSGQQQRNAVLSENALPVVTENGVD